MLILLMSYIIFTTTGMLLIKLGGSDTSFKYSLTLISIQFNPLLLAGLILYVISFFLYIILIQKANLSYLIPLCAGAVNVVAVLMGVFILKERLVAPSIFGIFLVIAGVTLISVVK